MPLASTFIRELQRIEPRSIFEYFNKREGQGHHSRIELTNEVRPADLFCYLGARFGTPNGLQNLLRSDDSDNLFHWDWTLRHEAGLVQIVGMNFRTEITIFGLPPEDSHKSAVIEQIKADFPNHSAGMGNIRKGLEHWTEFVNPYQRVRRAVQRLMEMLDALELKPEISRMEPLGPEGPRHDVMARWEEIAANYTKAFGLCFGIRSMLPVMAEAFVNLLLFILLRPEIKADQRLLENVFRQPIDVRIKSMAINCIGFKQAPDYASDPCRAYHRLVNERNDLLHGNVVVDKLKFNDLFFWGKVPVFKEYKTMWERSFQIEADTVGLDAVRTELATVDALIDYLLSCIDERDDFREKVKMFTDQHHLGRNDVTGITGVLFPGWLVDARVGPKPTTDQTSGL